MENSERGPFVEKANCVLPHKNNGKIDHNQLQMAVPAVPPNWVQNANYGTNILTYSSDEMDAAEENHRNCTLQLAAVNDEEILSEPSEYAAVIMQHDTNSRNTPLINLPNNSINNADNADNADNANINTSFSLQPNGEMNRQEKIKHVFINQSLNQHITMSVNVNKDDELIKQITN